MVLKEFIENEDPNVRVKYMGQNGLDITNKVVMHDSDEEDDFDDDDECCHHRFDKENNMEYGRDAINTLKADPINVPVATYEEGSKFYIDYDDLAAYMEAADIDTIEEALDDIIDCHESSDMDASNIVVVLPENAEERFSSNYIDSLDESAINFEM